MSMSVGDGGEEEVDAGLLRACVSFYKPAACSRAVWYGKLGDLVCQRKVAVAMLGRVTLCWCVVLLAVE